MLRKMFTHGGSSHDFAFASAAVPSTTRRDVSVLLVERVPVDAMRPVSTSLGRDTPFEVLLMCDRFEVRGIDAGAVPAKVVEFKADRDVALEQPVHQAVDAGALSVEADIGVSVSGKASCPDPAAIFTDLDGHHQIVSHLALGRVA